jgi:ribosomal protein S24E
MVANEKTNSIFGRKELEIAIEHSEATPSKAVLQQYIAKERGVDAECIEIKNIISMKGSSISKSIVYIWNEKKVQDLSKKVEQNAA